MNGLKFGSCWSLYQGAPPEELFDKQTISVGSTHHKVVSSPGLWRGLGCGEQSARFSIWSGICLNCIRKSKNFESSIIIIIIIIIIIV